MSYCVHLSRAWTARSSPCELMSPLLSCDLAPALPSCEDGRRKEKEKEKERRKKKEREEKREEKGGGERAKSQNGSPGFKSSPIGLILCVLTNLGLADTIRYQKTVYLLYCGLEKHFFWQPIKSGQPEMRQAQPERAAQGCGPQVRHSFHSAAFCWYRECKEEVLLTKHDICLGEQKGGTCPSGFEHSWVTGRWA